MPLAQNRMFARKLRALSEKAGIGGFCIGKEPIKDFEGQNERLLEAFERRLRKVSAVFHLFRMKQIAKHKGKQKGYTDREPAVSFLGTVFLIGRISANALFSFVWDKVKRFGCICHLNHIAVKRKRKSIIFKRIVA